MKQVLRIVQSAKLVTFLLFILVGMLQAEPKTMESSHYIIYYQAGDEKLAGEVLTVAEEVWHSLARSYNAYDNYDPIEIFLNDVADRPGGNAIYPYAIINVSATRLDWVMRGRLNSMRNVVVHELAHVFSLRTAIPLTPIDAAIVQSYTWNRDLNFGLSIPWIPRCLPIWYVEGIAQFEATVHRADRWDSQRDMILRDAYLTNTLPNLAQVETFDGDWVQAERTYNTGYAFLLFLDEKYGTTKIRELAFNPNPVNFAITVKKVYGKSLFRLYREFEESLEKRYGDRNEYIYDEIFRKSGSYTNDVAFSPDGGYAAWLGNEGLDWGLNYIYWEDLSRSKVFREKVPTGPSKRMEPGNPMDDEPGTAGFHSASFNSARETGITRVTAPSLQQKPNEDDKYLCRGLEFNPASTRLLTVRPAQYYNTALSRRQTYPFDDIWEFDFKNRKWHRLTWKERASYASYHPSGKDIVFARSAGASANVAILEETGRIRQLTNFVDGERVFSPRYNTTGDSIYFVLQNRTTESIVRISAEAPAYDPLEAVKDSALFPDSLSLGLGQTLDVVLRAGEYEIRDLLFQDTALLFSWNISGSFQVYEMASGGHKAHALTSAPGQALEPAVHKGSIYYTGYRKQEFSIFKATHKVEDTLEISPPVSPYAFPVTDSTSQRSDSGNVSPYDSIRIVTEIITRMERDSAGDTLRTIEHITRIVEDSIKFSQDSIVTEGPADTGVTISPELIHDPKVEYAKIYNKGHSRTEKLALGVMPYATLLSRFLSDTTYVDRLNLGLEVALGNRGLMVEQVIRGEIAPPIDFEHAADYSLTYIGTLDFGAIRHTRFSWLPRVRYALNRSVSHFVTDPLVNKTFYEDPSDNCKGFMVTTSIHKDILQYQSNYAGFHLPLPLGFSTIGRYWSQKLSRKIDYTAAVDSVTYLADTMGVETNKAIEASFEFDYMHKQPLHEHYAQRLDWNWSKGVLGRRYPTMASLNLSANKWWTKYADIRRTIPLNPNSQALESDVGAGYGLLQKTFSPWNLDADARGMWSPKNLFTLGFNAKAGLFTQRFPYDSLKGLVRTNDGSLDTLGIGQPASMLWPLYYRLGINLMPGFGYNLYADGRDILRGTALGWARFTLSKRLKVHAPMGRFPVLTSLNEVSFIVAGNIGTTMNTSLEEIYDLGVAGEIKSKSLLLADAGARVGVTFLGYHMIPMTIFAQAFRPVVAPELSDIGRFDYHREDLNGDGIIQASEEWKSRNSYQESMTDWRFFVGFMMGY